MRTAALEQFRAEICPTFGRSYLSPRKVCEPKRRLSPRTRVDCIRGRALAIGGRGCRLGRWIKFRFERQVLIFFPSPVPVLQGARAAGLSIFHTREGHLPDLSDCPTPKTSRQTNAPDAPSAAIGQKGPGGDRLLVRGEL